MIKRCALVLLCVMSVLTLASCTSGGSASQEVESEDMFFAKKEITQEFRLNDKAIVNPFMGFAADARSEGAAAKCSLIYVDVTFRELQPENESSFAFDAIAEENHLKRWKAEGKHIVLRFVCDQPEDEKHMDIPDWLYEKTGDGSFYNTSYGQGYSPDYNNKTFISYHEKAIEALGNYFASDNFVSFVELGSLGHWGEWHVKYEDGITPIPAAAVRESYIKPYLTAFPNAKILMRRPFAAAKEHGFGVYNDMAGEPDSTAEWLGWIENGGDYAQTGEEDALVSMKNFWKTAPVGGELNSVLSMDYMCKTDLAGTTSLIAGSHTTFLGPKCPVSGSNKYDDEFYQKAVEQLICSMGYRIGITKLEISKINSNGIAQVDLTWENKGVAPLYFDLPLKLSVNGVTGVAETTVDVDFKLSELQPGKTLKTSAKIRLGENHTGKKLMLHIIDPLTGKGAVQPVNDLPYDNGAMQIYSFQ